MTSQDLQAIADQIAPGSTVADPETFAGFLAEQKAAFDQEEEKRTFRDLFNQTIGRGIGAAGRGALGAGRFTQENVLSPIGEAVGLSAAPTVQAAGQAAELPEIERILLTVDAISKTGAGAGTETFIAPAVSPFLGEGNSFQQFTEDLRRRRQEQGIADALTLQATRDAFRESEIPTPAKIAIEAAFDPLNLAPAGALTTRTGRLAARGAQEAVESGVRRAGTAAREAIPDAVTLRRTFDSVSPVGVARALDNEADDAARQALEAEISAARSRLDEGVGARSIARKAATADVAIPEGQVDDLIQSQSAAFNRLRTRTEEITADLARQFREAAPLSRAERARIISEGRSRQAGAATGVLEQGRGQGRRAFAQARAAQRGGITPEFQPPTIDASDADTLFNYINELRATGTLRTFTSQNAGDALAKLLDGQSPARAELRELERVFGRDLVDAFVDRRRAITSGAVIRDILGVPKTIRSAYDISFPFRQGLVLGPRNPREWGGAFVDMFRSIDKKTAFKINSDIFNDPDVDFAIQRGLFMQDVEGAAPAALRAGAGTREEAFISPLAEKIPIIGRGVKFSERTFNTMSNQLKYAVLKKTLNHWRQTGYFDNIAPGVALTEESLTPEQLRRIDSLAAMLNVATGRGGSLRPGVREQILLDIGNNGYWSPRLTFARGQIFAQLFDPRTDPAVRRQIAENLAAMFGLGATVLGVLEATIPGVTVEKDPRSPDFGKIRFGETRYDFWGGFQQLARYMTQIATNQNKSPDAQSTSFGAEVSPPGGFGAGTPLETNRFERFVRFNRSKIAPGAAAIISNELFGSTFLDSDLNAPPERGRPPEVIGQGLRNVPITTGGLESAREQEGVLQITPLFAIDLVDAMENYGLIKGTALSIPTLLGVGTQTFNPDLSDAEIAARSANR